MKLTKEQVLNEPAGPRIDAVFAEVVMKYKVQFFTEKPSRWMNTKQIPEEDMININEFNPSTNIAHAMEGENKLNSHENQGKYVGLLGKVLLHDLGLKDHQYPITLEWGFHLIHATPHQRCRALILWAMGKEE